MGTFQGSLLDVVDLVDGRGDPVLAGLDGSVRRTELSRGAWVDLCPGWVRGADELHSRLVAAVPWRTERRRMYDRIVDVPRLAVTYGEGTVLPDPALEQMRSALGSHYQHELGEPFATAGMCLYRDGRDSVAWHGDTKGRGMTEDTMVAIVSLGTPRRLSLRPRGGGPRVEFSVGHGDLLVMGGSCQRTWEHAVLKSARPCGSRISVQFRPRGVS